MLVVELLVDVRLELAIVLADGLDDLLALAPRGRLDEVGDLRGVQLGQLRVGNAQPHRRHMPDERLDARPVEELAGCDVRAEPLRQQTAQPAARTCVDADHAPGSGDQCQLDLVRAHQPGALHVDQLPVEQIALQQHLLGAALEVAQVELGLAQDDAAGADLRDALDAEIGGPAGDASTRNPVIGG